MYQHSAKLITQSCIRKLYKDLLRYSEQLQYTDREYFLKRIRKEFSANKHLTKPEDIQYYYQKGLTLLQKRAIV